MLPGLFAAPASVWIRRRRLALVALAAAAVAACWLARRGPEAPPPALTTVAHVCSYPAELTPPPPPKPEPPPETWDLLERCLRAHPEGPPHRALITVAAIRGWIALPRATWFHDGAWWFPLSDEGSLEMPSGDYISVPLDGSACGGAIIN